MWSYFSCFHLSTTAGLLSSYKYVVGPGHAVLSLLSVCVHSNRLGQMFRRSKSHWQWHIVREESLCSFNPVLMPGPWSYIFTRIMCSCMSYTVCVHVCYGFTMTTPRYAPLIVGVTRSAKNAVVIIFDVFMCSFGVTQTTAFSQSSWHLSEGGVLFLEGRHVMSKMTLWLWLRLSWFNSTQ